MPVTVLDVSVEMKGRVEPLLERIFGSWDIGDLTISRTCAHVLLESTRSLAQKKTQTSVLSSTVVFLTALLTGRSLAEESGAGRGGADPGDERLQLKDWAGRLWRDHRDQINRLLGDFFASEPKPGKDEFEDLPDELAASDIQIGPGLLRNLRGAAESGPITTPRLLQLLIDDNRTRLAERLSDDRFRGLLNALDSDSAPRAGRHARMFREAEEDELVLGVREYAKAVATVLRAAKGEFTFALFGRWGSGKTTLVSLLVPLLRDPKKYRTAISAPQESVEFYARRSYRVAVHNAWKYRSRPEAWVYAYKSLADEARRGFGPIGRIFLSIRTSVHRRGVWPIVGALLMLALVAVPVTAKLQLAVLAVSVAGFSTILYLGAVTTSVSGKVRSLFAKHLRLSPVDERLGMLALVGDDVRALLAAWTTPLKGDEEDRPRNDLPPGRLVLPILVVAIVALGWAAGLLDWGMGGAGERIPHESIGLIPQSWADATALLQGGANRLPSMGEWLVFALWSLLAAAMLALPWLAKRGRPSRVLMVIDDLDRCSAEEMLDVIEGMRLLVDDSAVNRRLQVLMLVDESILNDAIALRYAAMIDERVSGAEGDERKVARARVREEVVAEQYEKLFACHVRLASLADSDVEEVVKSLAGREQRMLDQEIARKELLQAEEAARSAEEQYQRVLKGTPDHLPDATNLGREAPSGMRSASPEDRAMWAEILARNIRRARQTPEERLQDNPDVVRSRDEAARARKEAESRLRPTDPSSTQPALADPLFNDTDVRFTAAEVEDLGRLVPGYLRALGRRPSPRAVRILLFKIQLCRLLLQLRHPARPGERSIEAILQAFTDASRPAPTAGAERAIVAIARQVV